MNKKDYKRLGDYIREVDVRNKDLKVTNLIGLTINKSFITSVANVIGTDLSNYKVIHKEQFACSLMQVSRDGKMPIAMFDEDKAIMSPAYPMFEIINKNELLPQYLMMWFMRNEFDREASFYAIGGVRGSLTWEDFCDLRLPIPSIEKQREIVSNYETLTKRIQHNERMIHKLEETAQTIYHNMFIDEIDMENLPKGWRIGNIGEYSKVISGFAFKSEWWSERGLPVIKIGSISNNFINKSNCDYVDESKIELKKCVRAKFGDLLIAMTGATIGKIALMLNKEDKYLVNQRVGLFNLGNEPIKKVPFLYILLKQKHIKNEIYSIAAGSAQANISSSEIENIKITLPPDKLIDKYNNHCKCIFELISNVWNENIILSNYQSLQLTKM